VVGSFTSAQCLRCRPAHVVMMLCVQVDYKHAGASWFFNIFDTDGSIVRHAQPSKPAGPYWINSYPDFWKLGASSWKEPLFKGALLIALLFGILI